MYTFDCLCISVFEGKRCLKSNKTAKLPITNTRVTHADNDVDEEDSDASIYDKVIQLVLN